MSMPIKNHSTEVIRHWYDPFMIENIEGIVVMVSDQQKALKFYTEKLGFEKKIFEVSSYHYKILKQNTITTPQQLDVFSVGYEIDIVDELDIITKENKKEKDDEKENNNVTNTFLVNSYLPFPVSGEYFNPSYVIEPQKEFEFELIKYLETKSNKPPIPITIPIPDNSEDIPDDLSITITGTIELTFPDDPITDLVPDDPVPDDIISDDPIIDNTTPDDPITDLVPDDVLTDDNIQSTQGDNSSLSVIMILAIVLGTAGFIIWRKPSFVGKDKNRNKQNITRTKIAFDDSIIVNITSISD